MDFVYAKHRACGTELVWKQIDSLWERYSDGSLVQRMEMFCPVCRCVVFPGGEVSTAGPYVAVRQLNDEVA